MTQNALSRFGTAPPDDSEAELLDEALARVARAEMALAASGGTLHDVNNLLTVLSGNLYLLTESFRENATALARCRSARDTAQRAAALIRELLAFSRPTDSSETCVCPVTLLENLEPVLQRSVGDDNSLAVRAAPQTWRVAVSVAQLESAIANLVLNAKHALKGCGSIEIDIANMPATAQLPDSLPNSDYVRISVRDDGAGIAADQLSRVTQPMVTSKPRGQGSGMGLTMVCRFAQSAGGRVTIESTEGQGTNVSIWLPRASETAMTANLTMPVSTLPSGNESILVAVKDVTTAGVIQQLLEALGYHVITVNEPPEISAALMSGPDVALVIGTSDFLQQELCSTSQGRLTRTLTLINPGDDTAEADTTSIYLPISIPELAQTVRHVLDGD